MAPLAEKIGNWLEKISTLIFLMKISVITPSYNQATFLDTCIRSVRSQRYPLIEHIIMDGGSTDGSIDIIKSYRSGFSHVEIGPDGGQSSAINRGIAISSGDVVCWLNSDDAFLPGAIDTVMEYFAKHPECEWLTGNCQFTDIYGNPSWFCEVKPRPPEDYLRFWDGIFLPQPSVFFKRSLWDRCGKLEPTYNYAMDLDLWLRFLVDSPLHYLSETLSINRVHGATKTTNGKMEAVLEIAKIISTSRLNEKEKFDIILVRQKVNQSFISNEMNKYRSDLTHSLTSLTRYKLDWKQKLLATSITAMRLLRHLS